jgi:hypothetical protein
MSEPELTASVLREAFQQLAVVLERENLNADVFVFRGAAMVLGYDARPTT